ncbi:unnamed protein product [Aureobasidium mustum]|uniref:FHA domain-containing protein n=1 Tax=Aureobasidium mustum TaxID=2773714 RepID=A0A9N8PD23_9PEZI|nr:unnamed protein product [Aureobasidium mustum]
MTAPSSHTQAGTRVTVFLHVNSHKGAQSTGPTSRTLIIPEREPVLIGRASLTKNREPAIDNALFTCPVMSRSHATLSMPQGPYGPIILEDTDSMHGVYVNGNKISRTEIKPSDDIIFGSKVTRAEGTHDGVRLTMNNISREGATFSNPIDLSGTTKTMPPASYRVPGYETDSSRDDSINTTFEQPAVVEYIDLDPVSSPARSHGFVESEDEFETQVYYNGADSDSEFDSDDEANDYPENPDEFDDDDEQSLASLDGSRSRGSSLAWEGEITQRDQVDSELYEVFGSHKEPETAATRVDETAPPKATYIQGEEKEKARETAEIMSLPWILEPSDRWNTSAVTLTPNSIMPKVPSTSIGKVAELPPISEGKKDVSHAGAAGAQDTDKDIEDQDTSLKGQQTSSKIDKIEDSKTIEEKEVAVPTANELFAKVDSPTGSKRKRDIEDDGHEDVPAPSTERKLLKLKFNKQQILKDFFKGRTQATSRPAKRAKPSPARFALGAFAGAIGGVATVVGVLMTPQCEQLLANWPIS